MNILMRCGFKEDKMVGFRTVTGSVYYVNQQQRLFYGGKFKNPQPYVALQAVIGTPAIIQLVDGRVIKTSNVQAYI